MLELDSLQFYYIYGQVAMNQLKADKNGNSAMLLFDNTVNFPHDT